MGLFVEGLSTTVFWLLAGSIPPSPGWFKLPPDTVVCGVIEMARAQVAELIGAQQ